MHRIAKAVGDAERKEGPERSELRVEMTRVMNAAYLGQTSSTWLTGHNYIGRTKAKCGNVAGDVRGPAASG